MNQRRPIRPSAKKSVKASGQQSTKKTAKDEPATAPTQFVMETEQFFSDIDVLSEAFRTVMPVLEKKDKQHQKHLKRVTADLNQASEP